MNARSLVFSRFLPVSVGAILRFAAVNGSGFWSDEISTVFYLQNNDPHAWFWDANLPTHQVFLKLWLYLMPLNEISLRLPSAIFSVLTLFVAARIVRDALPSAGASTALWLFALNPLSNWYAGEARNYALLELAGAVGLWALLAAERGRISQNKRLVLSLLAPLVGGLGVPAFAAGYLAWPGWRDLKKRGLPIFLASGGLFAVSWALVRGPSVTWLDFSTPAQAGLGLYRAWTEFFGGAPWGLLVILGVMFASPPSLVKRYFLILFLFLLVGTSLLGKGLFAARFWLLLVLPLCLIAASCWGGVDKAARKWWARGLVVALVVIFAFHSLRQVGRPRGGWREMAYSIAKLADSNFVVGHDRLSYYFRGLDMTYLPRERVTRSGLAPLPRTVVVSEFDVPWLRQRLGEDNVKVLVTICQGCFEPVILVVVK